MRLISDLPPYKLVSPLPKSAPLRERKVSTQGGPPGPIVLDTEIGIHQPPTIQLSLPHRITVLLL